MVSEVMALQYYQTPIDQVPKLIYYGKEHLIPPTVHRTRTTDCIVLYYILSGRLLLESAGEAFELLPGDVCLFGSGEFQKPLGYDQCEYYYLHFELPMDAIQIEDEHTFLTGIRNGYLVSIPDNTPQEHHVFLPRHIHLGGKTARKEIEKHFETGALREQMEKKEYYKSLSAIRILEILILLFRAYIDQRIDTDDLVQSMILFLEESFSQNIDGNLLEETFHYSFDYLNRRFKTVTGKTIFSYLREVRISNATRLLQLTSLSVSEIAQQCGFCDLYYFSRAYKKETGKVPTAVRKQKPSA